MDGGLKTTFLPSEVARLVLGYLKEQLCTKAAESFLRDCIHLAEYRSMLAQGFSAPLTIGGNGLVEMLCHCDIYSSSITNKPKNKEVADLWTKLEQILSQLKSFSASVMPSASVQQQIDMNRRKLPSTKAMRILQTGLVQQAPDIPTRDESGSQSNQASAAELEGPVEAETEPKSKARRGSRKKKQVKWSSSTDSRTISDSSLSTPSAAAVSALLAISSSSSAVLSGVSDVSYSDIQVTKLKDPKIAPILKSPLKGNCSTLTSRKLFTGQSKHSESHPVTPAAPSSTAPLSAAPLSAASLSAAPLPKVVDLYIPSSTSTTLNVDGVACSGHQNISAGLSQPEKLLERSPLKVSKNRRKEQMVCNDIDREVSMLLNELFPMENVVEKLVHDDTWAQDLADSINQRKDETEHLAVEKIPEVLDITKADPTFDEFHQLIETKNKRKGRPTKRDTPEKITPQSEAQHLNVPEDSGFRQLLEDNSQLPASHDAVEVKGAARSRRNMQPVVKGLKARNLYDGTSTDAAGVLQVETPHKQQRLAQGKGKRKICSLTTTTPNKASLHPEKISVSDLVPGSKNKSKKDASLTFPSIASAFSQSTAAENITGVTNTALYSQSTLLMSQTVLPVATPAYYFVAPTSQQTQYAVTQSAPSANPVLLSNSLVDPGLGQPTPSKSMGIEETTALLFNVPSVPQETHAHLTNSNALHTVSTNSNALHTASTNSYTLLTAPTNNSALHTVPTNCNTLHTVPTNSNTLHPASTNSNALHTASTNSNTLLTASTNSNTVIAASINNSIGINSSTNSNTLLTAPTNSSTGLNSSTNSNTGLSDSSKAGPLSDGSATTGGEHHKTGSTKDLKNNNQENFTNFKVKTQPLAKSSEDKNSIVTAKWSPSLVKLVEKVSPERRPASRRTSHIRHLRFSPKSSKVKRSPFRATPPAKSAYARSNPNTPSPSLYIDLPSTPKTASSSPSVPDTVATESNTQQQFQDPRLPFQQTSASPQPFISDISSPPSVGGPLYAASPMVTPPRTAGTPTSLLRDASGTPLALHAKSQAMPALRRSPRVAKSTPSSRAPTGRRVVPAARKGSSMWAGRSTPSKGTSPSVVMAGSGGSITSITVAESTPKGKNSTPTLISSPELRKAVGAILDQGSEYLMGAIEGCDPGVRYQELPPVMEIVEASGQSTNINTHDIQGQVNVTEDSKLSADTVGVAEALVELAGGGNLSVFTP